MNITTLGRATKETMNYLRGRGGTRWRRGDDDKAKWHEWKGDEFFDFVEFYKKEAAKGSTELNKVINSSDPMMYN